MKLFVFATAIHLVLSRRGGHHMPHCEANQTDQCNALVDCMKEAHNTPCPCSFDGGALAECQSQLDAFRQAKNNIKQAADADGCFKTAACAPAAAGADSHSGGKSKSNGVSSSEEFNSELSAAVVSAIEDMKRCGRDCHHQMKQKCSSVATCRPDVHAGIDACDLKLTAEKTTMDAAEMSLCECVARVGGASDPTAVCTTKITTGHGGFLH